jgi:formate dehydrogenase major subunit
MAGRSDVGCDLAPRLNRMTASVGRREKGPAYSMADVDRANPQGVRGLGGFVRSHVGFVPNPISRRSKQLRPRIEDAHVAVSVCPYCGVGCSQLIYHKDGKILDIEGNPESPISGGHLCPKGAATYQLSVNPNRPTKVLYRAPRSDHFEERPLDWAMNRIAHLVKETRDADFTMTNDDGVRINNLPTIAHVGGATLDNEENYLILKLWRALGITRITNQARI